MPKRVTLKHVEDVFRNGVWGGFLMPAGYTPEHFVFFHVNGMCALDMRLLGGSSRIDLARGTARELLGAVQNPDTFAKAQQWAWEKEVEVENEVIGQRIGFAETFPHYTGQLEVIQDPNAAEGKTAYRLTCERRFMSGFALKLEVQSPCLSEIIPHMPR
jgi:hypothetical protein